nr:putative ribonuclease h protein [Quercus suber]
MTDTEVESDADEEDLPPGEVVVKLTGARKAKIRATWNNALIVKVFDKTVGCHYLVASLTSLWKPGGKMACIALGHDFFLIRFSLKEDHSRLLRSGLWFVGGHYLSIRRWEANFKPSLANLFAVAVWIRLPELPIEYYEESVLWDIRSAIGPVFRVDTHTALEVVSKAHGDAEMGCASLERKIISIPTVLLRRIDPALQPINSGKADEKGGEYDLEDHNQLEEVNGLHQFEEIEATELQNLPGFSQQFMPTPGWPKDARKTPTVGEFVICGKSSFYAMGYSRKKRILARLKGIQECLSQKPNSFLIDLEGKFRLEYAEVAKLEEEFWAIKARILWNEKGEWVKGFACVIETTTSVAAELWALKDGIRLCIALKLSAVVIELDSKLVVDLLKKELNNPNDNDVLVADCRNSLRIIPSTKIQHYYREGNKCTDALARRGAFLSQDFSIFLDPPSDVAFLLSLDAAGVVYDRFVSSVLEAN